ncbi:progesterone receptor-like isoform X2 [Crotalus tigris]|uniref:progesterone receptor-like isoform X2 n=1 Tax=Crotalus tigris TaxID=88082 RepID=UPI00192FB57C|nr:progesterone receptor-like isoform X2 [Crotalus tigris]
MSGGGDRRTKANGRGRGGGAQARPAEALSAPSVPRTGRQAGGRASSSRQAAGGLTLSGSEHHRRRRVPTAPPRSPPETAAAPDGQDARTFPFLSGDLEARHDPEGGRVESRRGATRLDPRSAGLLGRFARSRRVTGGGGMHRRLPPPAALRPDGRPLGAPTPRMGQPAPPGTRRGRPARLPRTPGCPSAEEEEEAAAAAEKPREPPRARPTRQLRPRHTLASVPRLAKVAARSGSRLSVSSARPGAAAGQARLLLRLLQPDTAGAPWRAKSEPAQGRFGRVSPRPAAASPGKGRTRRGQLMARVTSGSRLGSPGRPLKEAPASCRSPPPHKKNPVGAEEASCLSSETSSEKKQDPSQASCLVKKKKKSSFGKSTSLLFLSLAPPRRSPPQQRSDGLPAAPAGVGSHVLRHTRPAPAAGQQLGRGGSAREEIAKRAGAQTWSLGFLGRQLDFFFS